MNSQVNRESMRVVDCDPGGVRRDIRSFCKCACDRWGCAAVAQVRKFCCRVNTKSAIECITFVDVLADRFRRCVG
jgi:hypothetical protein